jgi:hypothetical protein
MITSASRGVKELSSAWKTACAAAVPTAGFSVTLDAGAPGTARKVRVILNVSYGRYKSRIVDAFECQ